MTLHFNFSLVFGYYTMTDTQTEAGTAAIAFRGIKGIEYLLEYSPRYPLPGIADNDFHAVFQPSGNDRTQPA